jgi:structural maintenance of chromosome 2
LQNQDSLEAKRDQYTKLKKTYDGVRGAHADAESTLKNAEDLLQSLLTGLGAQQSGGGGGYMGQLADARQRRERAAAEETQARTRADMAKKELDAVTRRWKEVEREAGESKKGLERMAKEVQSLRQRATQGGWSEEKEREMESALGNARNEARKQREVLAIVHLWTHAEHVGRTETRCASARAGSRSTTRRRRQTSTAARSRASSRR